MPSAIVRIALAPRLERAFELIAPAPPVSVIVVARSDAISQQAAEQMKRWIGGEGISLVPPPSLGMQIERSTSWQSIATSSRCRRITAISVPALIAEASDLALLDVLMPTAHSRPDIAIGCWRHFTRLLLRIGAAAGGARTGLTAEIASAFNPAAALLVVGLASQSMVVMSEDQLAAELTGLAVLSELRGHPAPLVPWQDPLVQQSVDLLPGINHPHQIDLDAVVDDRLDHGAQVEFANFIASIARRMSVPASQVHMRTQAILDPQ